MGKADDTSPAAPGYPAVPLRALPLTSGPIKLLEPVSWPPSKMEATNKQDKQRRKDTTLFSGYQVEGGGEEAERSEGGHTHGMEGDLTLGGERTARRTDDVLRNCTLEPLISLLTKVTPPNKFKKTEQLPRLQPPV